MSKPDVELIVDARAALGESPTWALGALYWIDVKAPALHRTDLASRGTTTWRLPADVGGYAFEPDGRGAVVALRTGIFSIAFADGRLEKLCDPPFDPRLHRFNEGDCDPAGRLWLGTMFEPLPGVQSDPVPEHLYSFTHAGGLVRHDDLSLLHNGFAWRPDGSEFLVADSHQGAIYACEFDLAQGRTGRRRIFATVPREVGIPDGGAFDEAGGYWSAIHRGGRLHRYTPDGRLDRVVELPVDNPTMMAFCSADLGDLCVTSATHGKPGRPHEGGLFRLRPGVRGLLRRNAVL
jgi:sugar lactone lactonase YvrE